MRGKIFGSVLGLGLLLAGPAQMLLGATPAAAEGWRGRGGYYGGGYGYGHRDHGGIGAGGVILGLAAVAGVAALASSAARHNDGYYDRGYYGRPSYGYGGGAYQNGYGYTGGYYGSGGYDTRTAISYCASAAVGQARGWSSYARFGHVDAVERRGDDVWVRGTVAVGGGGYDRGGYDRDDYGRGGYDRGGYGAREVRFNCKFDDGRVRSLRIDRPDYAYNGY